MGPVTTLKDIGLQVAVKSALNTVVQGGSFKDNLTDAAIGLVADILAGAMYEQVGDALIDSGLPKKVAVHALVGGLLGEAMGGDFRSAALAAGANEAFLELIGDKIFPGDAHSNVIAMTSQLIGTVVASAAGGSDKDQLVAGWVTQTATIYNHEVHRANAESAAKGMVSACQKMPDRCPVDASSLTQEDIIAVVARMASHSSDVSDLKPEAIGLFNFIYNEQGWSSQLEGDLFFPSASEKQRFELEAKAELALALLTLGVGSIKSGPSLWGTVKGWFGVKGNQLINGKWVDAKGLPLPVPSSVGASGRVPNVLQTGGNTLNKSTANALNEHFGESLAPREWGRALEALKADAGKLPNNFHGRILDNGNYVGKGGEVIGNIRDYLP